MSQTGGTPLLVRAGHLVTCAGEGAQHGMTFERLGEHRPGAVLSIEDRVVAVGDVAHVEQVALALGTSFAEVAAIDIPDGTIVPGFVDAHTHPLYAGDRQADFAARLAGRPAPLGMLHTVAQTRAALINPYAFEVIVHERMQMLLAHGTTTAEVKTGYGLTRETEIDLLDVVRELNEHGDVPQLVATFLGAHMRPPEFAGDAEFVDYLIAEVLPLTVKHGAVYADAFCEPGVFGIADTRRYLEAARAAGLRLRLHCDEMAYGQAAALAAELRVDAADHGNYMPAQDAAALAAAGVTLVACPATIFYLDLPRAAPVREVLQHGGTVALASDYNPGTSPCFNLQTVAHLGRKIFGLSAAEALYAVTRAAARSLRIDAGALTPGSVADYVVLRYGSPEEFGWQFGGNAARMVVRAGVIAHD